MKRTTASIIAAALLTLGFAGGAQADRGHRGGGHFSGPSHFRGGAPGFGGFHHFHSGPRIFIGGAFAAPIFYPPPVYAYPPAYYEPPPAYQVYWYCPAYGAYYPTVQQCPGGWQQVVQ